ncbi:MAG: hypothetical protein ACREUU_01610 [Gammaproteobacteria bacterium]
MVGSLRRTSWLESSTGLSLVPASVDLLDLLKSPEWRTASDGKMTLQFSLPKQGVFLVTTSW